MTEDKIFGGYTPFINPDKKWGAPEEPTKPIEGKYSVPSELFEQIGDILEYNYIENIQIIQDKTGIKLLGLSDDRILYCFITAELQSKEFSDNQVLDRSKYLMEIEYPHQIEIEAGELKKIIKQIKGKKDNTYVGFRILQDHTTEGQITFRFECGNQYKKVEKINVTQPVAKFFSTSRINGEIDFAVRIATNKLLPFTSGIFPTLTIKFDEGKPIQLKTGNWTVFIAPLMEEKDTDADL